MIDVEDLVINHNELYLKLLEQQNIVKKLKDEVQSLNDHINELNAQLFLVKQLK